jgi:hypothetical protein
MEREEFLLPGESTEDAEGANAPDPADERLEKLVQRAAEEALLWREEELDDEQEKATDYYMGRPFGTEVEGRSRVVSTDVRDTIQGILPSLMRIFFGPERAVQYEPRGQEDEAAAQQLTDMADVVIRCDNDGFLQIHGAMKDAMVRKLGVLKVWWEDSEKTEGYEYSGLSEQGLQSLMQDEDNEVEVTANYPIAMPGTQQGVGTAYDAFVTRRSDEGRCRFAVVPPEEFVFSPDARDRDTCDMMGHIREVPASELIAMGVDPDLVEEHKGRTRHSKAGGDDLEAARRFDQDQRQEWYEEKDESRESVWFGEVYVYADMTEDESGRAALIKARVIGDNHELVDWEYCHKRPFALFVCDPEPHTLIGLSTADYVMDIQLIKSHILRGMLDSLTLSLNPRTVASETEVNMADLLNHEVGGVIRVDRDVNAIKEFAHRFDQSGAAAFPMLQYIDEQRENRTGQSKAAAGLDADALQSSTKAAVAATLSASQQRIEMLARTFAETGFKQLYELILETLVMHQDQPRTVRLRNEWVEMDPSAWHTNLDVRVNLALGAGGTEEKLQLLDMITSHQKMLLDEGSPLVDLVSYRKGLGRMVELAGFPNADEFYRPFGPEEQQALEQQKAQQPPPQDPAMELAKAQIQVEQAKLQLDAQEAMMKDQRERIKMQMDFALKQATAELQYGAQMANAEIQADMQAAKTVMDNAAKEAVAKQQMQAQGGNNGPTNAGGAGPSGQGGGPVGP